MIEPLARAFRRWGLEAEVKVLPGPGTALDLVRERASGHGAVAAAGGDGTASEVAGALSAVGGGPLGLIPLGLGNCLARHLDLPLDFEAAAGVLARGRVRRLCLGRVGERTVVAFLGAGLDGAVAARVAAGRKGGVRVRDFVGAALKTLGRSGWPELAVEADGRKIAGRFYQAILSQSRNYALYFRLEKGEGFRLCLFGGPRTRLLRHLIRLGPRLDLGRAADLTLPVRTRLRLIPVQGQPLAQIDGEAAGPLPLDCEIRPQALEVLVP